jgi:PPK2 family polyphosphate:nucleotide phosphotransferase
VVDLRDRLVVPPGSPAALRQRDTRATPGVRSRKKAEKELKELEGRLDRLQVRLMAEARRSLLVVLQGMDTSGKDGTIKHAFASLSPSATDVEAFKTPTDEELSHDFLWRIRKALAEPGRIGIFNRSHYEDVVVARVKELVGPEAWSARHEQINAFERELTQSGTTVLKVFLHISREEQRERLLARLDDPEKIWKFNPGDLDDRARWDEYQAAYEDALTRCSTHEAPWYVVPADRKWYRNRAVTELLVDTLERMDPKMPEPDFDVAEMRAKLEAQAED